MLDIVKIFLNKLDTPEKHQMRKLIEISVKRRTIESSHFAHLSGSDLVDSLFFYDFCRGFYKILEHSVNLFF